MPKIKVVMTFATCLFMYHLKASMEDGARGIKISILNVICCTQKGIFLNTNFQVTDTVVLQNLIQFKQMNRAIKIHNRNSILKTIGLSNNGE